MSDAELHAQIEAAHQQRDRMLAEARAGLARIGTGTVEDTPRVVNYLLELTGQLLTASVEDLGLIVALAGRLLDS